jgi:wobble nucleotide-excising tRNase
MFKKIVIRNVGVLKAFDAGSTPPLSELSLFYARNGRGKSTLTAVMRAARDGCSGTVNARRSLGNNAANPDITLISDSGNHRFTGGTWQPKRAAIEVFDSAFIADNVFAGEIIELTHDRGLFSIIIGEEGVRLANLLERFNNHAKGTAAKIKTAEAALNDDSPKDISREEFFAITTNSAYADMLDKAEKALKVVQQADKIALLKPLEPIVLPEIPTDIDTILAATVADIDVAARDQLAEHFRVFKFGKQGEDWINYGIEHIHDDTCPFCGRPDADALGMVTLYGKIFGEEYKLHLTRITAAIAALDKVIGSEARAAMAATFAENVASWQTWGQYVNFGTALPDTVALTADLTEANAKAKALLDRKRQSPLEVVTDVDTVDLVNSALARTESVLSVYNKVVDEINLAATGVQTVTNTTAEAAKLSVDNVKKRIARTAEPGVQHRVDAYLAAKRQDERAKRARTVTQAKLKKANEAAAGHYHKRVNHYLEQFGVAARITKPTNSMAGNAGQADYSLIIKGESILRGRGRITDPVPSFRNTLSSGDKTTLALAFFLAKLDHDGALSQKVIVFDDPLASHDSHRRGKTVEAIKELCGRCRQLIVLSHDEYFLREIEKCCPSETKATYQMDYNDGDEWSCAKPVQLTHLCRSDHATKLDKLTAYADNRQGNPDDIVLHVRQVLETHYRRSYTAYFPHNRNLGQIVHDISNFVGVHPCADVCSRLGSINSATCDNHHGDDANALPKQGVDPDALKVIVIDALELIGARIPITAPSRTSPAITLL